MNLFSTVDRHSICNNHCTVKRRKLWSGKLWSGKLWSGIQRVKLYILSLHLNYYRIFLILFILVIAPHLVTSTWIKLLTSIWKVHSDLLSHFRVTVHAGSCILCAPSLPEREEPAQCTQRLLQDGRPNISIVSLVKLSILKII